MESTLRSGNTGCPAGCRNALPSQDTVNEVGDHAVSRPGSIDRMDYACRHPARRIPCVPESAAVSAFDHNIRSTLRQIDLCRRFRRIGAGHLQRICLTRQKIVQKRKKTPNTIEALSAFICSQIGKRQDPPFLCRLQQLHQAILFQTGYGKQTGQGDRCRMRIRDPSAVFPSDQNMRALTGKNIPFPILSDKDQ